jgi:Fe-S cluster biogenesis protein NfuA/nitrite reductase/ring-hydroxylating ferredoxin subunit
MADRPEEPAKTSESEAHWRTAGDRIQTLLDSCAAGGATAHERAQQLVREVVGLYGAALERTMRCISEAGDPALADRLAGDDLVASLLLVHGLHPHDLHRRVSDALDRVRPYLGSHGGDVDLIEVTNDGALRLSFTGSCKSCPSSAVTLELAIEDAVRAAAPEISSIEVVTAAPTDVIATESLMAHLRSNSHSRSNGSTSRVWHPLPEVADLEPGEVAGFLVAGTALLACRVDDRTFAYRDHCPVCDDSLAGARLQERLLNCPRCLNQFDVVHAGEGPLGAHLEPVPLLPRDGVLSVVLSESVGTPA